MASRKNSKADSQITSEIKTLDNQSLRINVLASVPWNQPPLCWLTSEQQSQLQNQSEIRRYRLGEKIWSNAIGGNQFFIVTGKVRLREEEIGKPLAALQPGDWFGDLQKLSVEYKAVA